MITAEYIDHIGDDLRVANAARVSFDKASEWDKIGDPTVVMSDGGKCADVYPDNTLSSRDAKLITFLSREKHFTPFTHCMITLRETVPIFVARQRFKHQVGFTYNEVSRRYVDDAPEFYTPDVWRKRADNLKQGSSDESVDEPTEVQSAYEDAVCYAAIMYQNMLEAGASPEQARMVLPQSMLTSYYVTGSLAAFARAYSLRTHKTAQRETQDLARQWDAIIRPLFPVSWAALTGGAEERVAA